MYNTFLCKYWHVFSCFPTEIGLFWQIKHYESHFIWQFLNLISAKDNWSIHSGCLYLHRLWHGYYCICRPTHSEYLLHLHVSVWQVETAKSAHISKIELQLNYIVYKTILPKYSIITNLCH